MAYTGRDSRSYRTQKERLRRTANVCALCGEAIDKTLEWPHPMSFSVDHDEPLSLRPDLAVKRDNLQAAHLRCNQSKGNGTRQQATPTSRDW